MTEEDAFLQAIIEQLDDDTPRLIYADWLEDHGLRARAEFIRLQCRLATMNEHDPARPDLLDRDWELLTVYRKRWRPAAPAVLAEHLWDSGFIRGFFARINVPAGLLLEHGEEWFRTFPIQELRIRDHEQHLGEIARRPWLAQVTSLDLTSNLVTLQDLQALLGSPFLKRLRRLVLTSVGLTPDGMELLARWPGLARLGHLCLSTDNYRDRAMLNNQFGPAGLSRLIESPHQQLQSVDLHMNPLTQEDVAFLANTPRLASLRQLRMPSCGITPACCRILGTATGLPALRHLSLSWNALGDEGNAALVGSPLLARLDKLGLYATEFGPRAAAALADSPHLGRLRSLDLGHCHIDPAEADALASARFGALTELILCNNNIGPQGMACLANSPFLAGLTRLDLLGNELGPLGARALAGSRTLTNLRWLELGFNQIGLDGVKALADSPGLAQLRYLSVRHNYFGARGAHFLMQSPHLAELRSLDLNDAFTDGTARKIARSTPLRQLRWLIVGNDRKFTAEGERVLAASEQLPHLLRINKHGQLSEPDGDVSPVVLEQGKGHEL